MPSPTLEDTPESQHSPKDFRSKWQGIFESLIEITKIPTLKRWGDAAKALEIQCHQNITTQLDFESNRTGKLDYPNFHELYFREMLENFLADEGLGCFQYSQSHEGKHSIHTQITRRAEIIAHVNAEDKVTSLAHAVIQAFTAHL